MSGTPKYSSAELERQRQQKLEEERRHKAAEEARLRAEATERERRQRLENCRNKINSQQQSVTTKIQQHQPSLYPQDATALQQRCQNQTNTIRQAQDESQLQTVVNELNQISQDCDQSATRKRRDDEEKKRKEEIERLRFELDELVREVQRIPTGDASKFDAAGQKSVQQVLAKVRDALASGNPQTVQASINNANTVVKQHTQTVTQCRAEWEKCKAAAEQVLGRIQDLSAGLKADPVVMRWHSHSIIQLDNELTKAQQAIVSEQFDRPSQILAKVQVQEKQIIEEANIAQLKADKRDYITQSIVATLQDMGFAVLSVTDEHTGHPSTAKVFTATAAGRAISVSVPVEGQVWYDVDGYAKNTVASVADGSSVAICDEAEVVLTEMHGALQQEFGIQMGEILWQGKDPNRTTRTATDLPTGVKQSRGGKQ
jgi:hypothetical protein